MKEVNGNIISGPQEIEQRERLHQTLREKNPQIKAESKKQEESIKKVLDKMEKVNILVKTLNKKTVNIVISLCTPIRELVDRKGNISKKRETYTY